MKDPDELSPALRLLIAGGIVFGVVFGGYFLLTNTLVILPITMLVLVAIGLRSWFSRDSKDA